MKTFTDFLLLIVVVWVFLFICAGNIYLCTNYNFNLWTGTLLIVSDLTIGLFIVFITSKN